MVTPAGKRLYQVESTAIVSPNYLEVLAPTPGETLTLVTCYPFEWFGHAPKRFIVRAHGIEDPTHSGARTSAMKEKTRSEESGGKRWPSINRSPPIRQSVPSLAKQAQYRCAQLLWSQSRAGRWEGQSRSACVRDRTSAPPRIHAIGEENHRSSGTPRRCRKQRFPETTEPALEADAPPTPAKGNRIMRGLKKLNPKRLVSKMRDGN